MDYSGNQAIMVTLIMIYALSNDTSKNITYRLMISKIILPFLTTLN